MSRPWINKFSLEWLGKLKWTDKGCNGLKLITWTIFRKVVCKWFLEEYKTEITI